MRQKLLTCVALSSMGVAFITSDVMAQAGDMNTRLLACRTIGDVSARAACYDRLVDALNPAPTNPGSGALRPSVGSPPPVVVPPTPTAPPTPSAVAPPAARFGAEALPLQKREPGVAPPPDQIIAKATSVRFDGSGYLVVTLDNGQVWRQTEGEGLGVKAGAEVKIRSGLLGSYFLSLTSGNRSVRVRRIN